MLVQRAGTVSVVDVRSGAKRSLAHTGARWVGVRGRHALFVDSSSRWYSPEKDALLGLAVLDVAGGEWLKRVPDDLTMVTVEKEQPEDAWLQDHRTGQQAAVGIHGDRPREIARTPDMRFVWIGSSGEDGGVYSIETARPWLDVHDMDLWRQRDARVIGAVPEPLDFGAAAIARTDVWWLLDGCGGVSRDGKVLFRIGWPATAAAFDTDATRLALVGDDFTVVRLDAPDAFTHRSF